MKSILLTTFILGLLSMTCLSQQKNDLICDTTLMDLSLQQSLNKLKPLDFKLNDPLKKPIKVHKYLVDSLLTLKQNFDLLNNFPSNEIQHAFDNMPVLKTEPTITMPTFVPDTTVEYSLLIKKIE